MRPQVAVTQNNFWFILIISFILPCMATAVERFSISPSTTNSSDGSVNLSWTIPVHAGGIELQQAALHNPAYEVIYTGADTATVITGLPDGNYLYRARLILKNGELADWTEPVSVNVRHHSLARAFSFFLIGALVFLGTLVLIVFGAKTTAVRSAAR